MERLPSHARSGADGAPVGRVRMDGVRVSLDQFLREAEPRLGGPERRQMLRESPARLGGMTIPIDDVLPPDRCQPPPKRKLIPEKGRKPVGAPPPLEEEAECHGGCGQGSQEPLHNLLPGRDES